MIAWPTFAAVLAAFLLTHAIPVRPAVKTRLQRVLTPAGFTVAYSALSLLMLVILIAAAKQAPSVPLWPQTIWARYVVLTGMLVVCLVAALAIGRPNPFSFGGADNDRFDPARPGIVRVARHPLLIALALWAGLHLLPNGDLAHVIMFATFLIFALSGRRIVDRRKRREMGLSQWRALHTETRNAPLVGVPQDWRALGLRLGAGVAAFIILILLHPVVLGVSALPV